MNNAIFGKTMESVRKHRNIQLLTIENKRNYLVAKPNYHKLSHCKVFSQIIYQQ